MSRKNKFKSKNNRFSNNQHSAKTKKLEKQTNHGFQEFSNVKELHKFFTSDPDSVPGAHYEPPLFKKPTKAQMARSEGKRQ